MADPLAKEREPGCAPERTKRAEAQAQKRAQILKAARAVFYRLGYDGASMNDIAAEAAVSKPTVYTYFNSKEELFAGLIEENTRSLPEIILALEDDGGDVEAALTRYGCRLMRKITSPDHVLFMRLVIGAAGRFPELGAMAFKAGPKCAIERLADYLRRRADEGRLKIADPMGAAWMLHDLIKSRHLTEALFAVGGTPSYEEIEACVAAGVRNFLAAVKP